MFAAEEIKKLKSVRRFVAAMTLAGFLLFIGAFVLLGYMCQAHLLTFQTKSELTLYMYAGISVGIAFFIAGLVLAHVFRILNKYMSA